MEPISCVVFVCFVGDEDFVFFVGALPRRGRPVLRFLFSAQRSIATLFAYSCCVHCVQRTAGQHAVRPDRELLVVWATVPSIPLPQYPSSPLSLQTGKFIPEKSNIWRDCCDGMYDWVKEHILKVRAGVMPLLLLLLSLSFAPVQLLDVCVCRICCRAAP